ncbi:MAG: branched-chain amino acid ABC transporter permease [Ardenticatenaceae bacterium]|nr:branched-chain amino acid ABC transporter permease [Ardenticatenaceae bacterium]MCB9444393.1 branched-chain amino acid ABC transporter permease [Ardenticatenaceae bacterium]
MIGTLKKNRTQVVVLAVLLFLFVSASQSMELSDWAITVLRGLSVGALTFLVAAGFSLIFGLMDVLNLAHGEMFMLGAYVGWTVYVRPDTFVDVLAPAALLGVGLVLMPVLRPFLSRLSLSPKLTNSWPWIGLLIGLAITAYSFKNYPITIWDVEAFAESPSTYSLAMSQGTLVLPESVTSDVSGMVLIVGLLAGGLVLGLSFVGFGLRKQTSLVNPKIPTSSLIIAGVLLIIGLAAHFGNNALTNALFGLSTTALFFVAMLVATVAGLILGAGIESMLIRPLYDRPIYQIMVTLGLSFIGIESVRAIWGRPEFTMPKPALFAATGAGCAKEITSFWERIGNQCSTVFLFDGRVRTYNEIFVIFVGVVVLIAVWLLLQRTRIGMIIRAGVQDGEMVEALGINVRQVFTFVFALGVGLAALGGVLAGPSLGLSSGLGGQVLLLALIALAIGGLTSFPGAAAGAVLVGLLQQFMIKYGQIGINLPFLAEPFKPSPPLVPASTVLLMVIILLILPQGLFGRKE